MKSLLVIANNNIGPGQSGGDTIFLELIKHWQKKLNITVFGSDETKSLLHRYGLDSVAFLKTDSVNPLFSPTLPHLLWHHLRRLLMGKICFLKHFRQITKFDYCYTVSDFYPDFVFGLLFKLINPQGVWISGHFLFAPRPGHPHSPYRHQPLKGWFYYLSQIPSRYLGQRFADIIYVTSDPDISRFPGKKVVVIRGGVDTTAADLYFRSKKTTPKKFEAVFMGRLHPQKGVLELVDIWQLVTKKLPPAKLAIIGDGQLESALKSKIKQLKLTANISLLGFQTGQTKYQIFRQSRLVVHPAIYDSGGMAAAEAMAWGLPGVAFDLEALTSYYPQGMLKTPLNNNQQFAANIIWLLTDASLYRRYSTAARSLIQHHWQWPKRAQDIFNQTFGR